MTLNNTFHINKVPWLSTATSGQSCSVSSVNTEMSGSAFINASDCMGLVYGREVIQAQSVPRLDFSA